eukprot:7223863-Prymnesium_polylepis.1
MPTRPAQPARPITVGVGKCSDRLPRPTKQGQAGGLTGGDAGSGQCAPLAAGRAGIASTVYVLGLDRLTSTGASLHRIRFHSALI